MIKINFSKIIKLLTILVITGLIGACSTTPTTSSAEKSCGVSELMERIAIEEFFYSYYEQFRPDSKHDFVSFFAEDGRMEVNGMVFNGLDEIKAIYEQLNAGGGDLISVVLGRHAWHVIGRPGEKDRLGLRVPEV